MKIKKEGYIFEVDLDATQKYYKTNQICDCLGCQNFYVQAKDKFTKLDNFLAEFGVDISRPDEVGWLDTDNEVEYVDITYTICGKILESDGLEIDIYDSLYLNVFVDDKYVPNNHKDEDWFSFTVFNVKLPWVIDR